MSGLPPNQKLYEGLQTRAAELGFEWFGVAKAEALEEEKSHLRQFIAEGRHGQMDWLAKNPERRTDPRLVLAGCQSVVVVGMNYQVPEETDQRDEPPAGKIAKYARGRDYHRVMDKPLKKLARFLNQHGPEGTHSKPYADHGPVMERQWAERAGIGFIGKHTLLINPASGSYFLLGVVLTTAELPVSPPPELPMGCGDCTRCIEACPTGAIEAEWRFDARRCLSYLTIEHKGEIHEELQQQFHGWVFGCDICQDVCPYNIKRAQPSAVDHFAPRLVPAEWSLKELCELTEEDVNERLRQSPLRRTGAEGLRRNALIVLGEPSPPK